MRWIFVRHGESTANAEGWLAGQSDAPLTELGRRQAEALRIDGFVRAYTSDLARARDTAEILVRGLVPIVVTPELRERHLGDWEGARRDVLRARGDWPTLLSWAGRPPGGESHRDVALRALTWLVTLPDEPALVVAHGGLLRAVIGLLDDVPKDEIGRTGLANTELVTREVAPARLRHLRDTLR